MNAEFVIQDWAAWAPGLTQREEWRQWAGRDTASLPGPFGQAPALAAMPAMSRRRLNNLGRMAAQVVYEVAPVARADVPVVYASRYGDAERALAQLADMVAGAPVSPTAFGLSVHNAIGALVAITRGDRAPCTAIAAGAATAGAALVEALGLLADGAREVLVVHYDEPLPGAYRPFMNEAAAWWAWAWRVRRPEGDEPRIRLELASADEADTSLPTPFGLALLHFALSGAASWEAVIEHQRWAWTRHG